MDYNVLENFIDFCDDMMIANEGFLTTFKNNIKRSILNLINCIQDRMKQKKETTFRKTMISFLDRLKRLLGDVDEAQTKDEVDEIQEKVNEIAKEVRESNEKNFPENVEKEMNKLKEVVTKKLSAMNRLLNSIRSKASVDDKKEINELNRDVEILLRKIKTDLSRDELVKLVMQVDIMGSKVSAICNKPVFKGKLKISPQSLDILNHQLMMNQQMMFDHQLMMNQQMMFDHQSQMFQQQMQQNNMIHQQIHQDFVNQQMNNMGGFMPNMF